MVSTALRRLPLAALIAWLPTGAGAETWTRVRGPRVEVITDAGERPAQEAAERLERLQSVLDRLLPPPPGALSTADVEASVTRAILLRRAEAVADLVPADHGDPASVAGFFVGGSDGPVIVVPAPGEAQGSRGWAVLDHECIHLHLNRVLPAQPVWVAEGLADALSGGELDGPPAQLGELRPDRWSLLQRSTPIPLTELLSVTYDSRLYRGDPRTDLLYAESEALVRFILARHGLAALQAMLTDIAGGEPPTRAFAERFFDPASRDPRTLDNPPGPLLRATPGESPPLVTDTPTAAEVEFRLGDVLMHGGRRTEAEGRFHRALQADPGYAPARSAIADLLLRKGKWAEAERELRLALANSPDDASALLRYARLVLGEARDQGRGDSPDAEARATAALERAVLLRPDLAEAAEMLARERPEPLASRVALLRRSFSRDPGRPELGLVLSFLLARQHDVTAARDVLVRARDATRDGGYRFVCDYRLRQLQGYTRATSEARGRLVDLDCRRDGSLRFSILVGSGRLPLTAASRQSLFVRGPAESEELQLTCGAQDLPVRVRFVPSTELGQDGTLLTLDAVGP
ncbi:MAG TPA: tetratricopeptide repeat protein [Vicinamibacteria bacterium]|nr:tetratricopeptide repeat protein [Vicinamibacteria bacterium]